MTTPNAKNIDATKAWHSGENCLSELVEGASAVPLLLWQIGTELVARTIEDGLRRLGGLASITALPLRLIKR